MGIGDWGLGIGDWGLANPQSPSIRILSLIFYNILKKYEILFIIILKYFFQKIIK